MTELPVDDFLVGFDRGGGLSFSGVGGGTTKASLQLCPVVDGSIDADVAEPDADPDAMSGGEVGENASGELGEA